MVESRLLNSRCIYDVTGGGESLACSPCEFGEQGNKDVLLLQMSWYINCAGIEISTVVALLWEGEDWQEIVKNVLVLPRVNDLF